MKKQKNAFTLVEILAVIVILAILLVIAVPKIISIIDDARDATFQSTVKVIVSQAEKKKIQNEVLGKNEEITCESVAKLNTEDYERCYINFDGNNASVSIKGSGKFDGRYICHGTKNNVDIVDECLNERVLVEFQNYGNMTNKTGIYKEGAKLELETPTKDKAVFLNWEVIKGDSKLTDNNELIIGEKDTVVRGNWKETSELNIDLDGGLTTNNQIGVYSVGDNITLERPTKTGYTFSYWDVVSGSSIVSGDNIVIGTDTTIKAKYIPVEYTITYNLNGGSASNRETYTIETEDFTLQNPTKEEYVFTGWTGSNGNAPVINLTILKGTIGNKEYIANYMKKTYPLTVDLDGGTDTVDYSEEYEEGLTIPLEEPLKDGYIFGGWTLVSGNGTISGNNLTTGDVATVVKATWILELNPLVSYSCSNGSKGSSPYDIKFTKRCTVVDDGNGNWRVKFIDTGTLTLARKSVVDLFLVGGGGGGSNSGEGGGGGGGYTSTVKNVVTPTTAIEITIGGGGGAGGGRGGTSKFGVYGSAEGGYGGAGNNGGAGGSGGAGGCGQGGYNGASGGNGWCGYYGGRGQGTSTYEFGDSSLTLYSGGGTGGVYSGGASGPAPGGAGYAGDYHSSAGSGGTNTGGGGGGNGYGGGSGSGGSGIVVMRNAREIVSGTMSSVPEFTYSGNYTIINDGGGNWRIKFLSSGKLKFSQNQKIDIFAVGGGGGGSNSNEGGAGGGGYTTTVKNVNIDATEISITVGAGGSAGGDRGSASSFGTYATAEGGYGGSGGNGGSGGAGGGGGCGNGGQNGSNGGDGWCGFRGGVGQGTTTCEFGESCLLPYSGGGAGGVYSGGAASAGANGGGYAGDYQSRAGNGGTNTGGGGGGNGYGGGSGSGGSGIVVIRNSR